jgi:hypothetical protein
MVRAAFMSARQYRLGLKNITGLNPIRFVGARLPQTPPAHGLPPKIVRMLANYRHYKHGQYMMGVQWRLPGYELLSRAELLRR